MKYVILADQCHCWSHAVICKAGIGAQCNLGKDVSAVLLSAWLGSQWICSQASTVESIASCRLVFFL